MTEPNPGSTENVDAVAASIQEPKVTWSQWALAVLLTTLVGLSAAALLAATIMELMFDSAAAWTRFAVLLPVLLIATYLLVQLWQKLINRRDTLKQ